MRIEYHSDTVKKYNEDIYGLTKKSAFVLDGASALSSNSYTPDKNDVSWMVNWWKEYLNKNIDDTTYTKESILFIQPSYVVDPTDRIGVKVYAETDRNSLVTLSMQIGDGNAAYFVTPLGLRHNQLRARDELDAHPIESITGLNDSLSTLQQNIDNITTIEEW